VALAFLSVAPARPAEVGEGVFEVRPGAVVRWPGDGIERCVLRDESQPPLDGACWFPIDLLAEGDLVVRRVRQGVEEQRVVRPAGYPYPLERIQVEDDSKVNPSTEDLARIAAEQRRVAGLWSWRTPRRFSLPLWAPLAEMPEGGRFGARRVFNGEPRSPHSGTDYSAAEGATVLAAASGRVGLAEEQFFAGRAVFLDHGEGLFSMYFHLSRILVRPGQEVRAGDLLGRVGSTGRVSGPHLHFAVRWRGARVDPGILLEPERATVLR
jgi:murein DD-endopeptidase MepM/ murein hydrolase activator NlpD